MSKWSVEDHELTKQYAAAGDTVAGWQLRLLPPHEPQGLHDGAGGVRTTERCSMSTSRMALWVELRRGSEMLLVPERPWFVVWTRLSAERRNVATWDEESESWHVPAAVLAQLASALSAVQPTEFMRTTSHFQSDVMSGTGATAALDLNSAMHLQHEVTRFVTGGPFYWRFISI